MKKLIFLNSLLLCATIAFSQNEPCKTMQRHQALMQSDPAYRMGFENMQNKPSNAHAKTEGIVYKIPVVVHVMHLGTAVGADANISDDQIYSAVQSLNNAYRKKSGTKGDGNGVDTEIEFCLAQKDPNGNPHSGINRINASSSGVYASEGITDDNEVAIKALSRWANAKYYNIWIVTEIDDNDGGSGTQGYAYFPGAPANVDGAVILYNSFGFDTTGSRGYNLKNYTNYNSTAIHEIGHGLDLYHTFHGDGTGSTCPTDAVCGTSGDCVADTPPHKRSNSDCLVATNTCTGTSSSLHIHNYMDYSSEQCQNEFTAGQAARMRLTLATGGDRASLVTSVNIVSCGCSGNTAPITRFTADQLSPCGTTNIQFTDESINTPIAWSWLFPGGTPSSSIQQHPTVTYNGSGPFSVTLTTTSSIGQSKTLTKTNMLNGPNLPFLEDFTSTAFPPAGWDLVNPDGIDTWVRTSASGNGTSTRCAALKCYNYNPRNGQMDDLISPLINLDVNSIEAPWLTFNVSYDQYSTNKDTLEVSASSDCGSTWTSLYKKYGSILETTSTKGEDVAPSLEEEWRTDSISLDNFMGEIIQIRFRSINDYGANIYLDDISVNGILLSTTALTTQELSKVRKPSLYPNPASQQVRFSNIPSGAKVFFVNQLGELVKSEFVEESGTVNIQGLAKGVYVVRIQTEEILHTEKLVVQP